MPLLQPPLANIHKNGRGQSRMLITVFRTLVMGTATTDRGQQRNTSGERSGNVHVQHDTDKPGQTTQEGQGVTQRRREESVPSP